MIEANNFAVGMIEWYGKRWQQEKGWAKEKQSPLLSKAQSLGRASHKGKGNQKIVKNGWQTVQANHGKCKQQQADFGHTWKRGTHKTQTSQACTQPIQDTVRSWVRGKRARFGCGEREKTYFEVSTRTLLGKCPVRMKYHPKEVKLSWNHQVHAMRDRERKDTQTIAGKGATADKQTKQFSPVW